MNCKVLILTLASLLLSGCSGIVQTQLEKSEIEHVSNDSIKKIISDQEKEHEIPAGMLSSIAAVESRYHPYAVNAKKKSHNFKSKEEASEFIKKTIDSNCKNVSIGCLQIQYKAHGSQFSSIENMLVPENNIAYGAKLLKSLYTRHKSWEKAIKFYHTSNPKYNEKYYAKVMKQYKALNKSR